MVLTEVAPTGGPSQGVEGSSSPDRKDHTRVWQVASFVIAIAVWWAVCQTGWLSSDALPTPNTVVRAWFHLLPTSVFWTAVGETLRGAVVGLLFAAVIGIPLGLITGTYAGAERASRLLVDVLRSFPVIALLPVFLLVLGSKPSTKASIVFVACVFPIFLQAQYGARGVDATIHETVASYRIPRMLRFRKVILPSATPSIMTGMRLAATTSVLVAIGVEILTTLPGMGHELTQAQQNGNSPAAFAYIFTSGLIGYAINKGSELFENHLLRWRPPAEPV